MISGNDIIYISSIEWSFLWQIHQEIAIRLARAGNRVFYIENTGVRAPSFSDAGRIGARLKNWAAARRTRGIREVATNLFVNSPIVLPPFGSTFQRTINRELFLKSLKRATENLGFKNDIIWTYLPTDTAVDTIDLLARRKSKLIYYCAADFSLLTPHAAALRKTEDALLSDADLVFAQCSELKAHCAKRNPMVHVFPSGVDLDAFPLLDEGAIIGGTRIVDADLARLKAIGSPIIGYVGGLHRFVDFDLIAEMARQQPGWAWVLIGPQQTNIDALKGLANVHVIDAKPHDRLIHFLRRFDVCIVPYRNTDATRTVVPVKVNEYLAAGRPVASTDLPALVEFDQVHKVLELSAPSPEPFIAAIKRALLEGSGPEKALRRRSIAELSDWSKRLNEMSELIENRKQALTESPPVSAGFW